MCNGHYQMMVFGGPHLIDVAATKLDSCASGLRPANEQHQLLLRGALTSEPRPAYFGSGLGHSLPVPAPCVTQA